MLLKSQRNKLLDEIVRLGLQPNNFIESSSDKWYRMTILDAAIELRFEVEHKANTSGRDYVITRLPGYDNTPNIVAASHEDGWESGSYGIWPCFRRWIEAVKLEVNTPNLWLEASNAIQLFKSAADLPADKFTIAELGALHGQLRMLAQLFENSELLREHKAALAELTQAAAVKAETFTKKDWQNWIKGAFISTIAALELTEPQTQELLALVRLAFGGLFLK